MPDPSPLAQVKVLVFDLMGTCTDWKSHILRSLEEHAAGHPSLASRDWSAFAQDWRMGFFRLVEKLASKHQNPSTSDDDKENTLMSVGSVYRQVLDELCERDQISEWSERDKVEINDSWGKMTGSLVFVELNVLILTSRPPSSSLGRCGLRTESITQRLLYVGHLFFNS
jgi:hypothetical protein